MRMLDDLAVIYFLNFPVETPATCFVSGHAFFKTFDNKFFNFPGKCTYELVSDCEDQTFRVHIFIDPDCSLTENTKGCKRFIKVYFGADTELILNGSVYMNKQRVSLPFSQNNLAVKRIGHYIIVDLRNGLKISWDGHNGVTVDIDVSLSGSTCGLCGNYNGISADDFKTPQVCPLIIPWSFAGEPCLSLSTVESHSFSYFLSINQLRTLPHHIKRRHANVS